MRIAVVVPVYCEQKNVRPLYLRLEQVTAAIPDVQWEYIFVNDGSLDDTYGALKALADQDRKVKVLDFSRNFGKEIALSAGAHAAHADAIICMDADLQHPPELISEMVAAWSRGAEVVVAVRRSIDKQPLLRRLGSRLYYLLMGKISGLDMVPGTTDFRLLDKKVIDIFRHITERMRLFRGIVDWMGFKKEYIYFHADARMEGNTSFSYGRLWHLAINSITSFSLVPLRLTAYLGMVITFSSGLLLARMLFARFYSNPTLFTPLAMMMVANIFLIGIVLMAIGLVALYIGTIHTEVINRPLYVVRHRVNFDAPDGGDSSPEMVSSEQDA